MAEHSLLPPRRRCAGSLTFICHLHISQHRPVPQRMEGTGLPFSVRHQGLQGELMIREQGGGRPHNPTHLLHLLLLHHLHPLHHLLHHHPLLPSHPQHSQSPPVNNKAQQPTQNQTFPQQPTLPSVLQLQNIQNTCYACAAVQGLYAVDVANHLQRVYAPVQDNLSNMLQPILNLTPNSQRFDIVNLINALNLCLPAPNMFKIGRQECAGEFLDALLENVNLSSHISRFEEFATCPLCNGPQIVGMPTTRSPYILLFPLDESAAGPAEVFTQVTRLFNQPHTSNVCQTVDCALCLSPLVAGRVQCTEQALKIFWIGRNLTARGGKCLQQIVEPRAHVLWRGRECVVVLAHSGRNVRTGHWFTFLKENGVWWRSDTSFPGPRLENPFQTQLVPSNPPASQNFTIDILIFK